MNNDTNNAMGIGSQVMDTPTPTPEVGNTPVSPVGGVVTPDAPISQVMDAPVQETPIGGGVMDAPVQETPMGGGIMDTPTPTPDAGGVMDTPTPEVAAENVAPVTPDVTPTVDAAPTPEVAPVQDAPAPVEATPIAAAPIEGPVSVGMPGFDDPGVVGTIPPATMDTEVKPQKPKNKIGFIILVVVVLALVGGGTYYLLKYTDLFKSSAQVTISTKEVSVAVGEELPTDITTYADINGTESKNCSLDTKDVDTSKAGSYQFTVTCGDSIKVGVVKVGDGNSETPKLEVSLKDVSKVKGETLNANEFIDNPNSEYTYEFADQEAVNAIMNQTGGQYNIEIKVTAGEDSETFAGTLLLYEYPLRGFVVCSSSAQALESSSAQFTKANRFAIVQDDTPNGFGKVAYEEYTYVFTDETEYNNYMNTYNETGVVSINNITGKVKHDDQTRTITISNYLDNNTLTQSFGADHLKNYASINEYFRTTLGYTCLFERSE